MAKLTKYERNVLKYPPNEKSWMCTNKRTNTMNGEPVVCTTPNSGHDTKCWLCGTSKPSKPKLLWPLYLSICKKAGVEPIIRAQLRVPPPEHLSTPKKKRSVKRGR